MGVAATLAPKGLVPQDPTKKLAHRVELLGQPLSQKKVFENLGPEPLLTSGGDTSNVHGIENIAITC